MKTNETTFVDMYDRMDSELNLIARENEDIRHLAKKSILLIRTYVTELKTSVLTNGFDSTKDEIWFFKHVKPRFYSRLIYYHKVLQMELNRPAGGRKAEIKYLRKAQEKLIHFFHKYCYLYQYCRSGADYLDMRFFTRGNAEILPDIETNSPDTDQNFTTGYDFVIAKMAANDLFRQYLESELGKLHANGQIVPGKLTYNLSWTASKASLIELLYGLQSTGVFNNGQAALSEVALFMEEIFQIKLGNYYRAFQEIRIRKKSRTQFLDEMKERLIQKMDYADENPKFN